MSDTENLRIETREEQGVSVVAAFGDIDLSTASLLRDALEATCSRPSDLPRTLVVDIREVSFIDSAGLALLVEMRKRFIERCHLALVIAKGSQPERVLKLGRFDTFLRVGYTLEEVAAAA